MYEFKTLDKPVIRLSNSSPGYQCGTSWGGVKPGDPNTPAYLNAIPIPGGVELRWAYPSLNPGAVSHTKVYRSRENDFSKADMYAIAQGNTWVDFDLTGEQIPHSYWIQVVSIYNTEGEIVGPARAAALDSIGRIIDELSGRINESHLAQALKEQIAEIPRISWLESRLNTEIADREFSDLELTTIVENLTETVDDSAASIMEERGIRADNDAALARAITELNVTMGDNLANASSVLQAGIKENENSIVAIGQRIDTLTLDIEGDIANAVSTLNLAIETEKTERGQAVDALAQQINQVEIDLGSELAQGMQALTLEIQKETNARNESVRILTESINAVQGQIDNDVSTALQTLTVAIESEKTARTEAVNILSQSITNVQSNLEDNFSGALNDLSSSLSLEMDGLSKRIDSNSRALTTVESTVNDPDTGLAAVAQASTDLQTVVNTIDGKVTNIGALYTAKVSVNGLVGGFGIYNDGTEIDAGFDVDTFWIGRNTLRRKPFIVSGSNVYISDAFIENGSITNAKIAELAVGAANIQRAAITDAHIDVITANKIDTRGLTIRDSAGNIIFGAGNNLSASRVSGLGTLATRNNITESHISGSITNTKVSGLGALATRDVVPTALITGLGTLATRDNITSSHISGSVPTSKISGLGAMAIVNEITSSNATTYIKNGAIKMAMIGDLVVGSAHIANTIQSTNYAWGVAGWRLQKSGRLDAFEGNFGANLQAATGTFSGTLTANAVNAVRTINIGGNSVTIHSAANVGAINQRDSRSISVSVNLPAGGNVTAISFTAAGTNQPQTRATVQHNGNIWYYHDRWIINNQFNITATLSKTLSVGAGTSTFTLQIPGDSQLRTFPEMSLVIMVSMR